MQQERINKLDPQTIWDVLLQYGGSISGLFDFLNKNELTTIDIPEGEYFTPGVLNEDVVSILNPDEEVHPVIVSGITPSSSEFIAVSVNGIPFNVWSANTTPNILVVDSSDEEVEVTTTSASIIIPDTTIQVKLNGILQESISIPFSANTVIDLI